MQTSLEYVFLLFAFGSVLGFFIETVFCYLVKGRLESRRGMLFGPFSQIYGFAALLIPMLLAPLSGKSMVALFLGSALLGGLFEAGCSIFQESCFGTVSWNYAEQRGSLFGGRTSLGFMFFWGVLGTIYIRVLHPKLFLMIEGVPASLKEIGVSLLVLFLSIDLLISCLALQRWRERSSGETKGGRVATILDQHFPNRRMESIYPDMVFVNKKPD